MAARVETRPARSAFSVDTLRRVVQVAAWAALVVVLGVAVALPDQLADALLGTVAVGATILTFIQPIVGLVLVLFVVPFGTRASATDTTATSSSSEPSVGAAELVVALL